MLTVVSYTSRNTRIFITGPHFSNHHKYFLKTIQALENIVVINTYTGLNIYGFI